MCHTFAPATLGSRLALAGAWSSAPDWPEKTALEVETALIDAYPGLTNTAGGTGSSDYGAMHAREVGEEVRPAQATARAAPAGGSSSTCRSDNSWNGRRIEMISGRALCGLSTPQRYLHTILTSPEQPGATLLPMGSRTDGCIFAKSRGDHEEITR